MRIDLFITLSRLTGTHGTTFGGSPLACALGHYVLSRISDPSFVAQIKHTSSHLLARASLLPTFFPSLIGPTVRGRGLIVGISLLDPTLPNQLRTLCRERGVLVLTAGKDAIRLVPSLNISQSDVDKAMDVLESCLGLMQGSR